MAFLVFTYICESQKITKSNIMSDKNKNNNSSGNNKPVVIKPTRDEGNRSDTNNPTIKKNIE
jgi:hypothetical protein